MIRRKRRYSRRLPVRRRRYMTGKGSYYKPGSSKYVRGSGSYRLPPGSFAKFGGKLGRAAGSWVGGKTEIAPAIFEAAGAAAGHWGGGQLAKLVGQGDYRVLHNSILHPGRTVPTFGKDSIRVRKREMITIIDSVSGFSNLTFPINAGLSSTFPWLSQLAANYEMYHFNGLVFQYISTSSASVSSTTDLGLGTVALCTDYNASDAPYRNLVQALGSMHANTGKFSSNIMHAIECKPSEQAMKAFYIRTGAVPALSDVKLYDMGSFQIVMDGPATFSGAGLLYCSYDVTLSKSVNNNQLGLALQDDHFILVTPVVTTGYFGTDFKPDPENGLGCTITGTTITFPASLATGVFTIFYAVRGDSGAHVTPTFTPTNMTAVDAYLNRTVAFYASNATGTTLMVHSAFKIDAVGASITLSGGTLPANATFGDLFVQQINADILE